MNTLSRELRKLLERKVLDARVEAEKGAEKALREFAVHEAEPYGFMNDVQKKLRLRLRAHGRQVGDITFDDKRQEITRLREECAYEHWHRMLFARFLAENHLLLEPETQAPVSLDECRELTAHRDSDWVALASEFAERMLPRIFRSDDPLLRISLPRENRIEMEKLLGELPIEVFKADDSLGWVYQFWQTQRKAEVNKNEGEIGARELAPVTQLFTEDYMVLFLLHNTLGAWWTSKRKNEGKSLELPGYELTYLRLNEDGSPAAGSFEGWPRTAREVTVLDPCMGSGHFLVFALPILVKMRMAEENLTEREAIFTVLRDNLFGLELDQRCTQIAAFNLALAAWKMAGEYFDLPKPNLACSGLVINAAEKDWINLAIENRSAQETMRRLYHLFQQASLLGSLIDPERFGGNLFTAEFEKVRSLLEAALAIEQKEENTAELVVTARGILEATRICTGYFTIVASNVPYLGREGHADPLKAFADSYAPDAGSDLATLMLVRCLRFVCKRQTVALVLPQNWWVGKSYEAFRRRILSETMWRFAVVLGEEAWWTFGNRGPNTVLLIADRDNPNVENKFIAQDVSTKPGEDVVGLEAKAQALAGVIEPARARLSNLLELNQGALLQASQARISVAQTASSKQLSEFVFSGEGSSTGDNDRFLRSFPEVSSFTTWLPYCRPGFADSEYCDSSLVMLWEEGRGDLAVSSQARIQNTHLWHRRGILIGRVRGITATLFIGGCFSKGGVLACARDETDLPAVYAFLRSREYENLIRTIDPRVSAATSVTTDVPCEIEHWRSVAARLYPNGLPLPYSGDPTQLWFAGHPRDSKYPLQVAVARLLGYRWPRQTGASLMDCPAIGNDGLEPFAEQEGIVCLHALKGHQSAEERLKELLAAAYGSEWSTATIPELLKQTCATSTNLEDWLRDEFFEQHCERFHQRPFIWHISDGLNNGFHALVNYHKLTGPNGEGRRTLDNLTYRYLGDWIQRKQNEETRNVAGAAAQLAAAEHLQKQLIKIIEGEAPYDIFVRWKPLHEQPIGWEPDPNDGVRLNIRPFMLAKPYNAKGKNSCILRFTPKTIRWDNADRGKEQVRSKDDFPWLYGWDGMSDDFVGGAKFDGNRWNGLHYSVSFKGAVREKHSAANKKGQHA
jgi:hypothetical protein